MNLNAKRVLIIKQSSLGDVIHTLPVVHALKRCFPTCGIGWVADQAIASLLAQDSSVNAVYPIRITSTSNPDASWFAYCQALSETVSTLRRLRKAFKAHPYDVVLDLHASFRSGCLALMNPGGIRIGFGDAREFNTFFQHHLVEVTVKAIHAVEKNQQFCTFFGCETIPSDYRISSTSKDEQQVEFFLAEAGVHPGEVFAYLNPTARWQSKFWLPSKWGKLCDMLMQKGVQPIFGGSGADISYIHEITTQMKGPAQAIVAAGRLSLTESIALLKRASVYIGLDTGPMHIAAMVGTPVVALFGPTNPVHVGPYHVKNAIIRNEKLDCLCCRKRTCNHLSCMQGIEVAAVYEQVMSFVDTARQGQGCS